MKSASTIWCGPIPIRAAFGTVVHSHTWSQDSISRGTTVTLTGENIQVALDDGTTIYAHHYSQDDTRRGARVIVYYTPWGRRVVGLSDLTARSTSVYYGEWWQVLVADAMRYVWIGFALLMSALALWLYAVSTPFSIGAVLLAAPIGLVTGVVAYYAAAMAWGAFVGAILVPPVFVLCGVLFRAYALIATDPGPELEKQRLLKLGRESWESAARSGDPRELPPITNAPGIPADAVLVTDGNGDPLFYEDANGRRYKPLSAR